ncbi:hypothetical protein O6H91_10G014600 [Diphasiastrum complanatum]|uniref:Uncharacterized protein n=2 Tax=Diphasiastrum complanatum TaxID=34168 RepID=A0ACC2CET9_DIPCM|nr:hypothetical protein O6H91_10G014600 [Diphasiastrum complanatum]KAJ7540430.1 hypothetical protein O6H91_10G014600 [Diphasiastrum complanatum]
MAASLGASGHAKPGPAAMPDIAAASVVTWNLELDGGLRSSKPGFQCEAVMKLGPRIRKWSQEPPLSGTVASLLKLDPGQDQAFANAILLRLGEAFKTGNNFLRCCILKVFLYELKGRKPASEYRGLFTKERLSQHVELLRRVKSVMDSGDTTARALSLRVLGCLAHIGRDSIDVQRLLLEALESPHRLEVEAAYFAIGCFCDLSTSFATLALEKILEISNAIRTTPPLRVGAIRLLGKMGISPFLSHKAHEAGKHLMLRLPSRPIVSTTLIALTELADISFVTRQDQVDLLFAYVSSEPRASIRVLALKCLKKLAPKAIHCVDFGGKYSEVLLSLTGDRSIPPDLVKEILQLLQQHDPSSSELKGSCLIDNLEHVEDLYESEGDYYEVQQVGSEPMKE